MYPLALLTLSIVQNNVLSIRHESQPFREGAGWVGAELEKNHARWGIPDKFKKLSR